MDELIATYFEQFAAHDDTPEIDPIFRNDPRYGTSSPEHLEAVLRIEALEAALRASTALMERLTIKDTPHKIYGNTQSEIRAQIAMNRKLAGE